MNATSPAHSFTTLLDWIDDRLGAIIVKEARQAVRSRFVVSAQFLLIVLLLVSLGGVLMFRGLDGVNRHLGQQVFMGFQVMLYAMCAVLVPLYVGVRLVAERSDANMDLLFSTTIRPWSVVLGKLAAGLMVGLLALSACAPFMVLSYFLRGVDVATIMAAIVLDAAVLVIATQLAIFIAVLPAGALGKGLAALVVLGVVASSFRLNMVFVMGGRGIGSWFDSREMLFLLLTTLSILAGVGGLLFLLSAALLSPHTANRALPVRVYLSVMWLMSCGGAFSLNFDLISMDFRPFKIWLGVWGVILCLAALVAGSERETLGPRMRAQIKSGGKSNWGSFLFYSGAAGGLAWVAGMVLLTGLLSFLLTFLVDRSFRLSVGDTAGVRWMAVRVMAGCALALGYVLVAGAMRHRFFSQTTRPGHTGLIAVVLMGMGILVPLLFAFFSSGMRWSSHLYVAFPLTVMLDSDAGANDDLMVAVSLAAMLLVGGLTFSWQTLADQAQVFARPKAPDASAPPAKQEEVNDA